MVLQVQACFGTRSPENRGFFGPWMKLLFERESGQESLHFEYVVLMRFSVGEEKDL